MSEKPDSAYSGVQCYADWVAGTLVVVITISLTNFFSEKGAMEKKHKHMRAAVHAADMRHANEALY